MNAVYLPPAGMTVSTAAQNLVSGTGDIQQPGSSQQNTKLMEECRQFESILIANLWNEMEKGINLSDPGSDPGSGTMQGFGIQAAATGIANSGGLGIARMLYHELAPHVQDVQSHSPTAGRDHNR